MENTRRKEEELRYPYLPEAMVIEILSRLPVKSLLRFRCVCKSWRSLAADPTFISKHLYDYTYNNDIASLLISYRDNASFESILSLFHAESPSIAINLDLPPFFTSNKYYFHPSLLGPINGIVCFYGMPDNIALWNPATREYKALPASPVARPPYVKVCGGDLGFGFDPKTNDYKVVQFLFTYSSRAGSLYQVEVYTLSTNSWRKFNGALPAVPMHLNIWSMTYRNSIFCWWAQDWDEAEVILLFDMHDEVFETTLLPPDIGLLWGENQVVRAIMPWNDSIALIVYPDRLAEKCFDIWVMNEFGLRESWSKLLSIGPVLGVKRPLSFWKNDELLLEDDSGHLVLYDSCSQGMKKHGFHARKDMLTVLVYKESLVSLTDGSGLMERNKSN